MVHFLQKEFLMERSDFKLELADQLIRLFARAAEADMPSRALRFHPDRIAEWGADEPAPRRWGLQPLVLFAIEATAMIRADGQSAIKLQGGDAIILCAREFLEMRPGGHGTLVGVETIGTQPCRFFAADAADPVQSRQYLEIFCTPFAASLPVCWSACNAIHSLLESARRFSEDSSCAAEPALRSVLRLCAIECLRALRDFRDEATRPVGRSNADRVHAADVFISCHIGRDIRKSELAERLGVSVSQLTVAFREIGHMAVRDRIRFRRVEFARTLLAETDLSVSEVAERVGMNYRHFIRAFRQSCHLTPLRYRKYARQQQKSPELWDELVHTEHFDLVKPLVQPDASDDATISRDTTRGSVTVLFSNTTSRATQLSLMQEDQTFAKVGIVAPEKRLAFLDRPGRVWKIQTHGSESEPTFFKSGDANSHFVIGSGTPQPASA